MLAKTREKLNKTNINKSTKTRPTWMKTVGQNKTANKEVSLRRPRERILHWADN